MNISTIVPTCGPDLEDTFSPKGGPGFFYPNHDDDHSFGSTESAYGEYIGDNEDSAHRNFPSRDQNLNTMDQRHMPSGLDYFAGQLPQSAIYETLVVGKQTSNNPAHVVGAAKNRSLIPNALPMTQDDDDNSFVSTVSAYGKYTGDNEDSARRNFPSRDHNHIAMDNRNMPSGLGYSAGQLSQSAIYETLVVGKQTSNNPAHVVGAAKNRSLIPNALPMTQDDDDNSFVSTVSAYGKYTGDNEDSARRNFPSRDHNHIAMDNRNMPSGLGYSAGQLSQSAIYETLVVGKQTMNNPVHVRAAKNRSLTPNTLPMEQSDSEWSSGSTNSDSTCTREQSRGHREGDFDSWPFLRDEASSSSSKSVEMVSNPNRKGTPTRKGAFEKIVCGAESIEHDFLSVLGSLLGIQMRLNVDKGDGNDVDDEDEIPTSRLYADLRKQRLRNQFLSFERDTLNQQLEERVQEIQKMKLKMHEQISQTKKFDEEKVVKSEKIAEMLNDLLETTMDVSAIG